MHNLLERSLRLLRLAQNLVLIRPLHVHLMHFLRHQIFVPSLDKCVMISALRENRIVLDVALRIHLQRHCLAGFSVLPPHIKRKLCNVDLRKCPTISKIIQ